MIGGLLETILKSQNGGAVKQLAQNFGLSNEDTLRALSQLVPALSRGVKTNVSSQDGLDSLMNALSRGRHEQYLDKPEAIGRPEAVDDGNSILGHILGSKDASRQVAHQAASNTGLGAGLLKKMLPVVATMAMGSLFKQSKSKGLLGGALATGAGGVLVSMLDRDNDGSMVDDLFGMARKLL